MNNTNYITTVNNLTSLNKYTSKIKKFLDINLSDEHILLKNTKNDGYDDDKIIKQFMNIFKNQSISQHDLGINLVKYEKVKKLHDYDNEPLLYIILKNTLCDNPEYKQCFTSREIFYDWIRENASKININDTIYSQYHGILFNPCKTRKELHKIMYESIFVSIDVIHHSESEDLHYKVYSNENTELHIYHPDSNDGPNIFIILKIIDFYRNLLNSDVHVKIVTFYGEQKKYLPIIKNKTICSDNVNSGSTIKGKIIQTWRKEEFYKVLIHEMVHYFGVDFYISDSIYKKINEHFQKFIAIKGVDRINESYTEVLAITIHSCLFASLNNTTFSEIFYYELLFSYLQVGKILNHFGCNCYDNLLDTNSTKIIQTTSAFSYYVIKCMFMENLQKILDFWSENGFTILKTTQVQYNYLKLYKTIVKCDSLNKILINKIINLLTLQEKEGECFVTKTMRMSMFQI